MALQANALVTMAEAKAALHFENSAMDAEVEYVINRASNLVENVYCDRPFALQTITNLRVQGRYGSELYPNWYGGAAWPIDTTGTIVVTVNGAVQTLWKSEADGDPYAKDVMVFADHFYRPLGWAPDGTIKRNVILTYDGGYDPVPEDLKAATIELVQKLWGPQIQGVPAVAAFSGPGGGIQTLDGLYNREGSSTTQYGLSKTSWDVFRSYRRSTA